MAELVTTDADTIREAIAAAVLSIVPRYSARRDDRFIRAKDQEIAAGSRFRTFDVGLEAEREVAGGQFAGGWYGGGVEASAEVEIRVSYPVSTQDARRFAGSDGLDIGGLLVALHTTVPGMFPISASGPGPVLEGPDLEGDSGRHVAVFRTEISFFASDGVTVD